MRLYRSGHYIFTSQHLRDFSKIENSTSKERNFALSPKMVNLFQSRAINLFERRKNKVQTQILTYHIDHESEPYKDLNRYLSNLRKNYDLNSYCSALEITKKNQYHFHLLMDMPFTKTNILNDAWIRASRSAWAGNALRDHRIVKSEIAVLKYCSDYLGKKQSKSHKLRKFSYSRNILGKESVFLDCETTYNLLQEKELRKISEYKLDYCTKGRMYLDDKIKQIFDAYYESEA